MAETLEPASCLSTLLSSPSKIEPMLMVEEVIFPALDLTLEVEAVLDDGMMKRSWREVEVKVGVEVKVEAGAGWLLELAAAD